MITTILRLDNELQPGIELLRMTTRNEVSGEYRADLELVVPDDLQLQSDGLVGSSLSVALEIEGEDGRPTIAGLIRSAAQDYDPDNGFNVISVTVTPRFAGLSAVDQCATYANRSPQELITEVLTRNGFLEGQDFEFRTDASVYPVIDFIAQFDEPDLDFIRRVSEFWGITYALEPGNDDFGLLVFADEPQAFQAIQGTTLPYLTSGAGHGITEIRQSINELPQEVVLQNYIYDPPQNLVVTQPVRNGTAGQLVEHDHNFRSINDDGRFLAEIRAEELAARRVVFSGQSRSITLRAGGLCTFTDHPIWNKLQLFMTRVETRFENTPFLRGDISAPTVTQHFEALPMISGGQPLSFRPPRRTAKPRIRGVIHGVIEEAPDRLNRNIDDLGRYRVRLLAHGSSHGAADVVYPAVRMAQPVGGGGSGMHFPLHPGTEVLLSFIDGDPDRPLICGAVPNTQDQSVVTAVTPGANMIRTASRSRLQFNNGMLAAATGGLVSGDNISAFLHVPYDDSQVGSYLRLGRTSTGEQAEARGPADATDSGEATAFENGPPDGWYDFSNGCRVSVTMGDSLVVHGGHKLERNYGDIMQALYCRKLDPLGSDPADDPPYEDEPVRVIATFATPSDEMPSHTVSFTRGSSSSYTEGTSHSFFAGARVFNAYGFLISNSAGIAYNCSVSASISFSLSASLDYSWGVGASISDSSSYGIKKKETLTAVEGIEFSLRNSPAFGVQLAAANVMRVIAGLQAASSTATGGLYRAGLEHPIRMARDAQEDGDEMEAQRIISSADEAASTTRLVLAGTTVLSAAAAAGVYAFAASKVAADAAGTGPVMKMDPMSFRVQSGPPATPIEALVELVVSAVKAEMKVGPPNVASRLTVTPLSVTAATSPANHVTVGKMGVQIASLPMGISVKPSGIMIHGQMKVVPAPPLPAPPSPPVPAIPSTPAVDLPQ